MKSSPAISDLRASNSGDAPLPNPRHEAFARLSAAGRNAGQAYATVYHSKKHTCALAHGSRLRRRPHVLAR
ncbi:MAG TPA: hypothetical protein VGL72_12325, partial [Bryobacteraceae bacterium]